MFQKIIKHPCSLGLCGLENTKGFKARAPVPLGIISCKQVSERHQELLGREAKELVNCLSPAFSLSGILAQPETESLSSRLAVNKVF